MEDRNIPHIWRLDGPPAGASVWSSLVGHLVSYGSSHYHFLPDYFCPHVITRGKGTVRASAYSREVKAGDMFTLWPGVEIEYFDDKDDPWEYYYFEMPASAQGFVEKCGFQENMLVNRPESPSEVQEAFRKIYELYGDQETNSEYDVLSELFKLPALCRADSLRVRVDSSADILFKAETLIRAQLSSGINVSELCSKIGVSRVTLFRVFQKELDQSPIEYLTAKRMAKAKELLTETQATLETISALAGFRSEKYFMRRFKESVGQTPSEYRTGGH